MFRCKFDVVQIIHEHQGRTLVLSACNSTEGDNQDWSKWTPSGEFKFHVTNENAFSKIDELVPGDLFWIDLTPVDGV